MGDWQYKADPSLTHEKQKVIAVPVVTKDKIYPGDVLLVCCDGIVEQMSNEDAAKIVYDNLPKFRDDPAEILSILFDQSLKCGSKDNHSALIILPESGTAYTQEDEFRAGPFTPFKSDQTFVTHYQKDAKKHGYEGDELMKLALKTEESMPELVDMVNNESPMGAGGAAQFVQILSQQPAEVKDKLMMLLSGGGPVNIQMGDENNDTQSANSIETVPIETVDGATLEIEEGNLSELPAGGDDPPASVPESAPDTS